MIDLNVYNELTNRGVITRVGLDSEKFESIDDLINAGIVTEISGKDQYNEIVNNAGETPVEPETPTDPETPGDDIIVDEGTDDVIPGGTIETPSEEEGEF